MSDLALCPWPMRALGRLMLVLSVAMVGCESPSATEEATLPPQLSHVPDNPQNRGSVSSSVTGNATFLVMGQRRHISFTALDQRTGPGDATVVGQFQVNGGSSGRVHGIITCFLINGNEAFIGGQIFLKGGGVLERAFRVVDNGPSGATPDRFSGILRPTAPPIAGVADAAAFCGPPAPAEALAVSTFPILNGNITVRDNPPL